MIEEIIRTIQSSGIDSVLDTYGFEYTKHLRDSLKDSGAPIDSLLRMLAAEVAAEEYRRGKLKTKDNSDPVNYILAKSREYEKMLRHCLGLEEPRSQKKKR